MSKKINKFDEGDFGKMIKNKRGSMIGVRGGFSESIGLKNFCTDMQLTEFDQRTRVILNNTLFDLLKYYFDGAGSSNMIAINWVESHSNNFCKDLISNVFAQKSMLKKGYSYSWDSVYEQVISDVFDNAPYNEVLDIIWYCCKWLSNNYYDASERCKNVFNSVFEKEYVGYRLVNGMVVPITDEIELQEINKACDVQFQGCKIHFEKALWFLSDRETPDYKNSIKESISAVEAICKIITDDSKSDLGKTLKKLKETGIHIHPTLEQAWGKLYAYTCDEGGVRHAEKAFESNVTFEEAKYMLVSCCAFVNYLIAEYGKIK